MTLAALAVEQAGPLTTIQDRGRFGYLSRGVSPAGPFDRLLHALANQLVGNPADSAAIEFVLKGDTYRIQADNCRLAVTGDFTVEIDGQKSAAWRTHTLRRGQALAIGHATKNARGYMAISGGLALPKVLGSHSVHTRTGIGPLGGSALKVGDILPLTSQHRAVGPELRFDPRALPPLANPLRVVMGPQLHHFSDEAVSVFLGGQFVLTPECDRMGFQLKGPEIAYRQDIPLISEGVALGSIQVLDKGLFIVGLLDRQTVGGYPKIATIISSDIRTLAHVLPGTLLRFEAIDVSQAQDIYRREEARIHDFHRTFLPAFGDEPTSEQLLQENLISGVLFAD